MQLPNFIIAGAPRSGTTWLRQLLSIHPSVTMTEAVTPEPKFFLVDSEYNQGLNYYSNKYFSNISSNQLCGEKTTNYLESPIAAKRIFKNIPNIKLIFILRDPVTRAWSNFQWSRHNGIEPISNFKEALIMENKRKESLADHLIYAQPFAYFSRGLYENQLQYYYNLFPKNNILLLRYEDITAAPNKLSKLLFQFLGIDYIDLHRELGMVNHIEEGQISPKDAMFLQQKYQPHNTRLYELSDQNFTRWDY